MKFVLLAALVAALVVPAAFASTPTLKGETGPAYRISLLANGAIVTHLKAGTYTVQIRDRSPIHNFHLVGPGVDKKTSTPGQGTFTWKVTLTKGTYKYICDPHKSFMKGSFTVS